MAADHAEHAEVESEAADEEQAALEELRRPCCPRVAVPAVAPDVADDEARQRDGAAAAPRGTCRCGSSSRSRELRRAERLDTDEPGRGPSSARRRASSSCRAVGSGSESQSASSTPA